MDRIQRVLDWPLALACAAVGVLYRAVDRMRTRVAR